MSTYKIEKINETEYIISEDLKMTLKVIPPHQRHKYESYEPYRVVAAIYEERRPDLCKENFDTEDAYLDALLERLNDNGGGPEYDFEGIDVSFADTDVSGHNKFQWLDAINYYCQLKLDRAVVDLSPYNYNYEINY